MSASKMQFTCLLADPDRERVQRIMRAAPGPEPVGEAEEVFLVDRVQHRGHRPLDDLVLQRGDRQRALPAVRLRDVDPPAGVARYAPLWTRACRSASLRSRSAS